MIFLRPVRRVTTGIAEAPGSRMGVESSAMPGALSRCTVSALPLSNPVLLIMPLHPRPAGAAQAGSAAAGAGVAIPRT